jgi:uncharacterized protein YkwD
MTTLSVLSLVSCGDDSWFAGQPCVEDTDCSVLAVCVDGTCSLFAADDTGVRPDVGGADTGAHDTGSADSSGGDVSVLDTGGSGSDSGADATDVDADPNWTAFGTTGSVTGLVNAHAQCDSRSVRTDDLSTSRSPSLGAPPWGSEPVEDEPAFCGTTSETLGWRLLNCERISRGLVPLRCDLRLTETARQHSADMIARGYFDHDDPEGDGPSDRIEDNGVTNWNFVGENITTYPAAEAAHLSWMESDGHRANILEAGFRWVGQGEAPSRSGPYTTQVFATYFGDR